VAGAAAVEKNEPILRSSWHKRGNGHYSTRRKSGSARIDYVYGANLNSLGQLRTFPGHTSLRDITGTICHLKSRMT
jgi:hypothetical protein